MKKSEALALQKKCEGYFNGNFGLHDVELSMALTGRLKLSFDGNFVTFYLDHGELDWVKFNGFSDDLEEIKGLVLSVCENYHSELSELAWSYKHIEELEDDVCRGEEY